MERRMCEEENRRKVRRDGIEKGSYPFFIF